MGNVSAFQLRIQNDEQNIVFDPNLIISRNRCRRYLSSTKHSAEKLCTIEHEFSFVEKDEIAIQNEAVINVIDMMLMVKQKI